MLCGQGDCSGGWNSRAPSTCCAVPAAVDFEINRKGKPMLAKCKVVLASLLTSWACVAAGAVPVEGTMAVPYIEVSAEAESRAVPDVAVLEFGVVTRAETAAAAAQQNAGRMKAVLAAVRQAIGPKAQIGTGTYALRTEYAQTRDGSEPRIVGYVASNIVRLETEDLSRLGEVIDVAIKAGSNQVQRISFALSDPASARRSALRDAVLQAQSDAEAMAAALKVQLGPVLSVTNLDSGPVRPFMQDAMVARAAMATTPIEPGQVSVRARVTLRVQIAR